MSTRRPNGSTSPQRTSLAVLVTLDAARWLPATLDALAKLDTRPTRLIAIDNASTDATEELLDDARRRGRDRRGLPRRAIARLRGSSQGSSGL
jgi:GT2 family glycosyltransferase